MEDGIYYIVLADLCDSTVDGAKSGDVILAMRMKAFCHAAKIALKHAQNKINSGIFVKSIGDAVLMIFKHFPDVVDWTIEFKGALRSDTGNLGNFSAKICVHLGEVLFDSDDPLCVAVSHLFKLEKKVKPGEIVLTETAFRVAYTSIYSKQFTFSKNGTIRLPGLSQLQATYKLVAKSELGFLFDKTRKGQHIRARQISTAEPRIVQPQS
jgi:class 3 adenylate cyclase